MKDSHLRANGIGLGNPYSLFLGLFLSLFAFGIIYVAFGSIADSQMAYELSTEDGPIEMAGAVFFLVVSLLQFGLFWNSRVGVGQLRILPKRNILHLGLALAFLFAFGEEISWGQRIIGWQTPEVVGAVNEQGETNLHNLKWFHGESILNFARLFSLFWLGYCVLVPILNRWVTFMRRLFRFLAVPVPALWISGVFLGCWIAFKVYAAVHGLNRPGDANELKESLLGICFVILSLQQWRGVNAGVRTGFREFPAGEAA